MTEDNIMTNAIKPNISLLDDLITGGKREIQRAAEEKLAGKKREKQAKAAAKVLPTLAAINEKDWTPVAQVFQLVTQTCAECKSSVKYIGGFSIREKHKKLAAIREIAAPLDSSLPVEIRYHQITTPLCASCLATVEVLDTIFSDTVETQMTLF